MRATSEHEFQGIQIITNIEQRIGRKIRQALEMEKWLNKLNTQDDTQLHRVETSWKQVMIVYFKLQAKSPIQKQEVRINYQTEDGKFTFEETSSDRK